MVTRRNQSTPFMPYSVGLPFPSTVTEEDLRRIREEEGLRADERIAPSPFVRTYTPPPYMQRNGEMPGAGKSGFDDDKKEEKTVIESRLDILREIRQDPVHREWYRKLVEQKTTNDGTVYRQYQYSLGGPSEEDFNKKIESQLEITGKGGGAKREYIPMYRHFVVQPGQESNIGLDAQGQISSRNHEIAVKEPAWENNIPLVSLNNEHFFFGSPISGDIGKVGSDLSEEPPQNWLIEEFAKADRVISSKEIIGSQGMDVGKVTGYEWTIEGDDAPESKDIEMEERNLNDIIEKYNLTPGVEPNTYMDSDGNSYLADELLAGVIPTGQAEVSEMADKGKGVDGRGAVARGDEIVGVEPAEGLKGFTLDKFLTDIGFAVPKDATGRTVPMDRFTSLPGFPAELLAPENLYIKITSRSDQVDPETGERFSTYVTNFEPNPAIEAALQLYGDRVKTLTNLQGSADDILAAQINATRGMAGPADGLTPQQLENLERQTSTIAASGGRLASEITRDAEGAIKDISYNLTPLGRQELAQEAIRATGGLSGGYYQPVIDEETGIPVTDPTTGEIIQQFVPGFNPTELATQRALEERGGFEVSEVLAQIQAQNVPAIFQAQLESQRQAREANLARQQQSIQQLAQIYQNPAALAGLVASGGNPLLAQLQAQAQGQGQGVQGSIPLNQAGTGPLGANQLYQNIFNTLGLVPKQPGEQQDQQTNVLAPPLNNVEPQVTTDDELRRVQNEMRTDMQRGYVRVIDPNTGQPIEIRPAREGGSPQTELITDAYGNERTVVVPGSYFETRVPGTDQTQNRFIRNDQLGTYSIDASQYTQLSQDPFFKGPPIEDIGYNPEDIESASVMVQAPPPPIEAKVPVPTASPLDNITEQQLSRMSEYEKLALTGRAASYGMFPEDITKAAEQRTPAPPGSPSFRGYLAPSPIGRQSVTGGGFSPSYRG